MFVDGECCSRWFQSTAHHASSCSAHGRGLMQPGVVTLSGMNGQVQAEVANKHKSQGTHAAAAGAASVGGAPAAHFDLRVRQELRILSSIARDPHVHL